MFSRYVLALIILDENLFLVLINEGLFSEVFWVLHRVVELYSISVRRNHAEKLEHLGPRLDYHVFTLMYRFQDSLRRSLFSIERLFSHI